MRDDIEIDVLASTWRTLTDDPALSVAAALRRRRRQRVVFALELMASGLALPCGAYFWLAGSTLVFRAAAVLLVVVGVVSGIVTVRLRTKLGGWADWTPRGILEFRLRECETALRSAWYALISVAILVAFATFVSLAGVRGWDAEAADFHRFYATLVAVTGLMGCAWGVWRIRTKRRERHRLHALLDELADE